MGRIVLDGHDVMEAIIGRVQEWKPLALHARRPITAARGELQVAIEWIQVDAMVIPATHGGDRFVIGVGQLVQFDPRRKREAFLLGSLKFEGKK